MSLDEACLNQYQCTTNLHCMRDSQVPHLQILWQHLWSSIYTGVKHSQQDNARFAYLSNVSVSCGALCSQSICQLTGQDVAQLHFETTELTSYPSLQYQTSQPIYAQ